VTAAHLTLTIEQGADFEHVLIVQDATGQEVNLTGYRARMHIRPTAGHGTLLHELTTDEGGGIHIDGPTGTLTLSIPATVTATFTWRSAEYDVLLIAPDGKRYRLVKGPINVDPAVTT